MNYLPFNLEKALAGDPVVTRQGHPVRIICSDRKRATSFTIVGLVDEGREESIKIFNPHGLCGGDSHTPNNQLFMVPKTKTVWINLYKGSPGDYYDSEGEALEVSLISPSKFIKTISVEIPDET